MLLSGKPRRRIWRLIGLAMLALAWLGAMAPQAQGFCTSKVVRDYKSFLGSLPPLPSPPINERLPFAPERVYFRFMGNGPLQVGAEARGVRLSFSPFQASEPSPTLNWHLTSTLTVIDEQGQPLSPAQTIEQDVGKIEPEGRSGQAQVLAKFDVPGVPALYRLEVVIENDSGEDLANFGEYFRVLEPSIDFRLSLNRVKVKPGQTFHATLSNPGVAWLRFGLYRSIEYWDGNSWTRPPVEFPPRFVPAIGLGMGPGEAQSCWSVTIPGNATPGRYRFSTQVGVSTLGPPRRNERPMRAGFHILPSSKDKAFEVAAPIPRP